MFDRMQITAYFELSELERIAAANKMESYIKGGKTIYQIPDEVSRFSGVYFKIENRKASLKFSLHGQYYKTKFGNLDNSGMFTMADAQRFNVEFFKGLGIDIKKAKVKYFEIGLNIPTARPPIEYIRDITTIGTKEKETFIDANWAKNRQRTTDRTRNLKKVFKIYDKLWEIADRAKIPHPEPEPQCGILRIETIYKRQSKKVADLFNPKTLQTLAGQFYTDWLCADFVKILESDKGINAGQRANAARILAVGLEGFYNEIKSQYQSGEIARATYRTKKNFADNWATNSLKFRHLPTEIEKEFKKNLGLLIKIAQNIDLQ